MTLRRDPEKVRAWLRGSQNAAIERARGREGQRSTALRSATPPSDFCNEQGEPVRPATLKRRRRRRREKFVPTDWTRRVFALQGSFCVVTGQRAEQAHHAVPVSLLIDKGLGSHAGDPRNGVPVTRRVHERHETAYERILRSCLPTSVFEFAAEHGLEWYLERDQIYPRIPPLRKGRV